MAVEISGKALRESKGNELQRLALLEQKYRGAAGIYIDKPFHVTRPVDEPTITHCWSLPEKVDRRKAYGWKIVTPERGILYGVRAEEIDKGAGCVRRGGLILMENEIEEAAGKTAHFILQANRLLDGTTDEFIAAAERLGAAPRDLTADKRYTNRLQAQDSPTPLQRRQKIGGRPGANEKKLQEQRMYQQLIRDAEMGEKNKGLRAALSSELPKNFDPDNLQPSVQSVDGVREIVISRDYNDISDAPDFE